MIKWTSGFFIFEWQYVSYKKILFSFTRDFLLLPSPFSIPSLITNYSIYCFNKMHENKNNKEMFSFYYFSCLTKNRKFW